MYKIFAPCVGMHYFVYQYLARRFTSFCSDRTIHRRERREKPRASSPALMKPLASAVGLLCGGGGRVWQGPAALSSLLWRPPEVSFLERAGEQHGIFGATRIIVRIEPWSKENAERNPEAGVVCKGSQF